ncbi:hypothetical protein LOTGIDRAFT_106548, partial [Lottia gigantea]
PERNNGSTTVTINVLDVNDNTPRFLSNNGRYVETVPEGIYTVASSRLITNVNPENGLLTYSITGGNTDSDFSINNAFRINPTSGEFSVGNVGLDYETQKVHYITVAAIDSGPTPRTGTVLVTVNVLDINDNNPNFNPVNYEVSIPESSSITPIVTVSAKDMDETANVVYKLVASTDSNDFTIDGASGLISSKVNALDFETKPRYVFRVTTTDGENKNELSGTATVTVNILNLRAPVFTSRNFDVTINETQDLGIVFIKVTATDDDTSGPFNQFEYYIVGDGIAPNYFEIDINTGIVRVRSSLSADDGEEYTLTARVIDNGKPPKEDTATIDITVNRVQPPRFTTPPGSEVNVREDLDPNTGIFTLPVTTTGNPVSFFLLLF